MRGKLDQVHVLLVEDHELIRTGLKLLLTELSDKLEVREAGTFEEAVSFASTCARSGFNLILLDLGIPGLPQGDWVAGLRRICATYPGVPVVILSGKQDAVTVTTALKNGARGFLPKTTRGTTVLAAIEYVLGGEIYLPPALIEGDPPGADIAHAPAALAGSTPAVPRAAVPDALNERELATMQLLIAGHRNKAIARELGIEEATVKKRLRSAFEKLGATSRTDAVRIFMERNMPLSSRAAPPSPVDGGKAPSGKTE